jgi:hypothetical protein
MPQSKISKPKKTQNTISKGSPLAALFAFQGVPFPPAVTRHFSHPASGIRHLASGIRLVGTKTPPPVLARLLLGHACQHAAGSQTLF